MAEQESIIPNLPRIEIEFCTACRWTLRAGWVAQELLITFGDKIGEVALVPGKTNAVFKVVVNSVVVWDRKQAGRFPELKELKQLIRDLIAPGMALGHSDSIKKEKVEGKGNEQVGATTADAKEAAKAPKCEEC
ncbi:7063_t:CDS:2 [Paraglomus occultum]|uniref:7063_t:CDS:1 n=1 Tax=Paraglomus occultum TaxID=144539 RepID=A0A9N9BXQ9_9GLOM|nr:7063_t:CDS:2 [Paraglomus occultum]